MGANSWRETCKVRVSVIVKTPGLPHGKKRNDFAEGSTIIVDTDLKIILLEP